MHQPNLLKTNSYRSFYSLTMSVYHMTISFLDWILKSGLITVANSLNLAILVGHIGILIKIESINPIDYIAYISIWRRRVLRWRLPCKIKLLVNKSCTNFNYTEYFLLRNFSSLRYKITFISKIVLRLEFM